MDKLSGAFRRQGSAVPKADSQCLAVWPPDGSTTSLAVVWSLDSRRMLGRARQRAHPGALSPPLLACYTERAVTARYFVTDNSKDKTLGVRFRLCSIYSGSRGRVKTGRSFIRSTQASPEQRRLEKAVLGELRFCRLEYLSPRFKITGKAGNALITRRNKRKKKNTVYAANTNAKEPGTFLKVIRNSS